MEIPRTRRSHEAGPTCRGLAPAPAPPLFAASTLASTPAVASAPSPSPPLLEASAPAVAPTPLYVYSALCVSLSFSLYVCSALCSGGEEEEEWSSQGIGSQEPYVCSNAGFWPSKKGIRSIVDILTQRFYGAWPRWSDIPDATMNSCFEMWEEKAEKRSIGQVELFLRLHKRSKDGTCVCPRAAKALLDYEELKKASQGFDGDGDSNLADAEIWVNAIGGTSTSPISPAPYVPWSKMPSE
ncbi:hypothetical protein CRG98_008759 [Punica granatum]|uniref:Uncharacterized protein n=1 Tax=Punica granatum TaxID=22663 RepID=A0A2I0KQU0_PUNGR|nr:hypothetical protein CRG98_008759 [Punica granatum]